MSRHEHPPFRMIIENGRLVPASAFDAERLDTYRRGTKVTVRFTEEKDRVMVRKWFAVLGKVVKECATPWKTKDEASEAIKLALGIVNLTKTVGGDYLAYPKSLTELTEPELVEAVEQMMALVQRITGVDPDTLRKEVADVGEEQSEETSSAPSPADDVSDGEPVATGGAVEPLSGSAPAESETAAIGASVAAEEGPAKMEAADGQPASPAPTDDKATRALMRECLQKFMVLAVDPSVPDAEDRRSNLVFVKDAWKAALPAKLDFVKAVFETADKIIRGELKTDAAKRYLEGLLS